MLCHLMFITILCDGIINLIFSNKEIGSKKLSNLPQGHMIFRCVECITHNLDFFFPNF